MELESDEGEKIKIESRQKVEVGRKATPSLFSDDLTISRTQISLQLCSPGATSRHDGHRDEEETMVSFHVLGRNPVCVLRGNDGDRDSPSPDGSPDFFKKSESGYLRIGDKISFSVKNPKFFLLKGDVSKEEDKGIVEAVERRKRITEERKKREREEGIQKMLNEEGKNDVEGKNDEDLELGSFDTSSFDPVKDFGFLVIGHEFDGYKSRLKDIRKWNWYVDDAGDRSEDGESFEEEIPERRTGGMKKKKRGDNDDEDWTGESDHKKGLTSKLRNGNRPRTRSTSSHEPAKGSTLSAKKDIFPKITTYEDDDDESLGGFIVNDEELEQEAEKKEEEEEEEEEEDYDEDEEEED